MMKGGREPHTPFRSCTWKNANEGVFSIFRELSGLQGEIACGRLDFIRRFSTIFVLDNSSVYSLKTDKNRWLC